MVTREMKAEVAKLADRGLSVGGIVDRMNDRPQDVIECLNLLAAEETRRMVLAEILKLGGDEIPDDLPVDDEEEEGPCQG